MRAAPIASLLVLAAACGPAHAPPPLHARPIARVASNAPQAFAGTFWEPEPIELRPSTVAAEPLTEERLDRSGGAEARWTQAPPELRAAVLRAGFAVVPRKADAGSLGAYYQSLQDTRTPALLTVDALFCAAHAALEAALAEVDRAVLAALVTLVTKLDERLEKEDRGIKTDWVAATERAQAIVAVARALLDPKHVVEGPIAPRVKAELEKVRAHVGIAESPVLGRSIDYSAFDAARGFADADDRLGAFRAATWLASAGLELAVRPQDARVVMPVERMRADTRAALLFARLLRADGEPEAARAWERIDDVTSFAYGPDDDLTPRELAKMAANVGVDVRDAAALQNMTRVERVRAAALGAPAPRVQAGVPAVDRATGHAVAPVVVRVLGLSAPADARAMQALVAPLVGPDPNGNARAMPSALDVGAWLGSREAMAALREDGALGYDGYSKALGEVVSRGASSSDPGSAHASLYASTLEALGVYLDSSAGDASAAVVTSDWGRRKLDASLAAWATLRHDATPFAHAPATSPLGSEARSKSDVPWAVEPHPEAIGRLASLVRQIEKGLTARWVLQSTQTRALLQDVRVLLAAALEGAVAEVNGEPPSASVDAVLGDLAGVFARIEARAGAPIAAPIVADVHTDQRSGSVLEVGTAGPSDLWAAVTGPRAQRPALFVGPHVGYVEIAASPRMNDRAWRARLASAMPARPTFTRGYVVDVTSRSASP